MKNRLVNIVARPIAATWERAYRVRRALYEYGFFKKDYFKVPIVSIGNVSFGGTGKTPLIIWLLEKIEQRGLTPVVLSRGYKGKLERTSGVLFANQRFRANPQDFGDEPLLIAKSMKRGAVIVGKKRAQNLKKYFDDVNPDIVLLDDGFQHVQLHRSYNIVLFDALLPLERYQTPPIGYLREGLHSLKHADAVLISRADQVDDEKLEALKDSLLKHCSKEIVFGKFHYRPVGLYDCHSQKVLEIDQLRAKKVVALNAIASPESFYNMLSAMGADIVAKRDFADHHFFSEDDIQEALAVAAQNDALVVTSEKDMVKIRKVIQDENILHLKIEIEFLEGEKELLSGINGLSKLDYQNKGATIE